MLLPIILNVLLALQNNNFLNIEYTQEVELGWENNFNDIHWGKFPIYHHDLRKRLLGCEQHLLLF